MYLRIPSIESGFLPYPFSKHLFNNILQVQSVSKIFNPHYKKFINHRQIHTYKSKNTHFSGALARFKPCHLTAAVSSTASSTPSAATRCPRAAYPTAPVSASFHSPFPAEAHGVGISRGPSLSSPSWVCRVRQTRSQTGGCGAPSMGRRPPPSRPRFFHIGNIARRLWSLPARPGRCSRNPPLLTVNK